MIAILWKELKSLQTSLMTVVLHFITPLFLLIFFATIMSRNLNTFEFAGMPVKYIDFFTPGLVGYVTFTTFQMALTFIRHDKTSGILGIVVLAQGGLGGYVGGKLAAQLIINLLKVLSLVILAALISGSHIALLQSSNLILFVAAVCLGSTTWLGLGLAIALVLKRDDLREVLVMLITLPLVFASSMYYDITQAPAWIRSIAAVNPLTYTCNLAREAYLLPDARLLSGDLAILAIMAFLAILLSKVVARRIDY